MRSLEKAANYAESQSKETPPSAAPLANPNTPTTAWGSSGNATSSHASGVTAGSQGALDLAANAQSSGQQGSVGRGGGGGSAPAVAAIPTFKGKDGKDYPTGEAATAADVAFDADVKARTGVDGVVYPTLEQKVSADRVTADEKAMGEIKAPTEANIMERAQNLSNTAQAGAVSSAGGAARAQGMSPAQAALMGSSAGASTYQNTIESSYGKAGDLALQSYTSQMQSALSKYATDVSAKTGLRGQDLQKYISDQGNKIALQLGQMNIDAQKQKDIMSGLGFVLQAGSWILKGLVLGLAKGTDFAAEGDYVVGEEGPEVVHLPQGAKVDPHDGYEMLSKVHREAMPRLAKYKMDGFIPPPYENNPLNGLGDKLQGYLSYLKGGK